MNQKHIQKGIKIVRIIRALPFLYLTDGPNAGASPVGLSRASPQSYIVSIPPPKIGFLHGLGLGLGLLNPKSPYWRKRAHETLPSDRCGLHHPNVRGAPAQLTYSRLSAVYS